MKFEWRKCATCGIGRLVQTQPFGFDTGCVMCHKRVTDLVTNIIRRKLKAPEASVE